MVLVEDVLLHQLHHFDPSLATFNTHSPLFERLGDINAPIAV
jgi:hypothetical protein